MRRQLQVVDALVIQNQVLGTGAAEHPLEVLFVSKAFLGPMDVDPIPMAGKRDQPHLPIEVLDLVALLREDMEDMGPVRLRDVDEAQSHMVNMAKELADKGEIVISDNKDEDELIY